MALKGPTDIELRMLGDSGMYPSVEDSEIVVDESELAIVKLKLLEAALIRHNELLMESTVIHAKARSFDAMVKIIKNQNP